MHRANEHVFVGNIVCVWSVRGESADDLMISVDTVSYARSIHHISILMDLGHRRVNM